MAIKYESALKWGEVFYLKSDPDQVQYNLVGIGLTPGKPMLVLRHAGYDKLTVYECETTREPDIKKTLDLPKQAEEEDDTDDE